MTASRTITPVAQPIRGTLRPPGSKSITNRALILAALAEGTSNLTGVLDSQDTQVMIQSLRRLGFEIDQDVNAGRCCVHGQAGRVPAAGADLWLENSGTSIRFLTSLCALGAGDYRLDGAPRMRQRPIGDLVRALRQLGAAVEFETPESDCPPVLVRGCHSSMTGGQSKIHGGISSQFLSSLLMSAPAAGNNVLLKVAGTLVSTPYIRMTLQMMGTFGVDVQVTGDFSTFEVPASTYQALDYDIEPDASAASYCWGAAAVTGGAVRVPGLHRDALQGDVEFVTALESMGCQVNWESDSITLSGFASRGIDIDMNAISDTAQTLAVVAVFASSPTTIRNVEHMRFKETDRIAALVSELRRTGIRADEFQDGLTVYPGVPRPATIQTYDDHRMAMSFSLLGLRAPGIEILDPGCTAKTYPRYFDDLEQLCGTSP